MMRYYYSEFEAARRLKMSIETFRATVTPTLYGKFSQQEGDSYTTYVGKDAIHKLQNEQIKSLKQTPIQKGLF